MGKEKNNSGLIIIVVILSLLVLGLLGYIIYDKALNNQNDDIKKNNDSKGTVIVKNFDIEEAKVVNYPNNHMIVSGKFVLEGNEKDYNYIEFSGYCLDTNDNKYSIIAPGYGGHKYVIGENSLDAAEISNNNYANEYNIYDVESTNKNNWISLKFKYCKFDKMKIILVQGNDTSTVYEDINFEKSFN